MRINRAKLRELINLEFGPGLKRISPAGARDFLNRLYREHHVAAHPDSQRIEINESAGSYEQIMAEFFTNTLDLPAEDAAVMLWLYAFEQHYTSLQEEYSERFVALFDQIENLDATSENDNE